MCKLTRTTFSRLIEEETITEQELKELYREPTKEDEEKEYKETLMYMELLKMRKEEEEDDWSKAEDFFDVEDPESDEDFEI
ncbi:hypothetical protein GW932_00180 [archaeon]|nr:hypothetical protein [archaeon]